MLQGFTSKMLSIVCLSQRQCSLIPKCYLYLQDTTKYIHRVGRSGRAGKSGMSILLYKQSELRSVQDCEKVAVSIYILVPETTSFP